MSDNKIVTAQEAKRQIESHQEIIEVAMSRYRAAINTPDPEAGKIGSSNEAMFDLTLTLRNAGVGRIEAATTLAQAANESRSNRNRIPDAGRYMKRYW